MLLDANILLYAVDVSSPQHDAAARWLTAALNGPRRIAIPWQTIGAFLRIATHPRVTDRPLSATAAWSHVEAWLAAGPCWIPPTNRRTAQAYATLVAAHQITGNLVSDAMLAALALEHGLTVVSADSDFARFGEVRWLNPVTAG